MYLEHYVQYSLKQEGSITTDKAPQTSQRHCQLQQTQILTTQPFLSIPIPPGIDNADTTQQYDPYWPPQTKHVDRQQEPVHHQGYQVGTSVFR